MHLVLAQTFLEIASAGSLVRAGKRLGITQAAVSARLQQLETLLGERLLVRNKGGARLTAAGRAFVPLATQLTQIWEQAKRDVATHEEDELPLAMGGEVSLWSSMLLNWIIRLRTSRPKLVLRTHVDTVTRLLDQVQSGTLDLAVAYSPHRRPGVDIVPVMEEDLVAVSTTPGRSNLHLDDYVFVDWGPDFCAQHDQAFPELRAARTHVGLGPLALRAVLATGGTGYFRTRAVAPHLTAGTLHRVEHAPTFSYSVYAAYSRRTNPDLLEWALGELRESAGTPTDDWA